MLGLALLAECEDVLWCAELIVESPSVIEGAQRCFRRLSESVSLGGRVSKSNLTIHLLDDKHEHLKALARSNSVSVNKLMAELATVALPNFDARVRLETRAARGNPKRVLSLFDKMDRAGRQMANP